MTSAAASSDTGLLLIAHGTRDPRGAQEMDVLLGLLRDRVDGPVGHAWIEDFAEPDVVTAAGKLVAGGAGRIVGVPFLVLRAGHARYDVPAMLAEAGAAHPDVTMAEAGVLGLQDCLFDLAAARIDAVCPAEQRAGAALLVTGSGSSDAGANGDLAKATRLLAERTGFEWAEMAFAGVTWPTADLALRRLAAAGAERVVRFSWSLLAGLLEQRVAGWADEIAAQTALDVVDAGRFGPDPLVADAVVRRYREALEP